MKIALKLSINLKITLFFLFFLLSCTTNIKKDIENITKNSDLNIKTFNCFDNIDYQAVKKDSNYLLFFSVEKNGDIPIDYLAKNRKNSTKILLFEKISASITTPIHPFYKAEIFKTIYDFYFGVLATMPEGEFKKVEESDDKLCFFVNLTGMLVDFFNYLPESDRRKLLDNFFYEVVFPENLKHLIENSWSPIKRGSFCGNYFSEDETHIICHNPNKKEITPFEFLQLSRMQQIKTIDFSRSAIKNQRWIGGFSNIEFLKLSKERLIEDDINFIKIKNPNIKIISN